MKKIIASLCLLFVLSISVLADGDIGMTGKTCGQGGQPACFTAPPAEPEIKPDTSIFESISVFVKNLFS